MGKYDGERNLTVAQDQAVIKCDAAFQGLHTRPVICGEAALELMKIECPKELRNKYWVRPECIAEGRNKKHATRSAIYRVWNGPIETKMVLGKYECAIPALIWAIYAKDISLEELVILGECMLRRNGHEKSTTIEEMEAFLDKTERYLKQDIERKRSFRGIAKCRQALRLMRENTDSSYETRTRLLLMKHGFGEPVVNHRIDTATRLGKFYLDMAYPELHIAVEYDGRQHATQWEDDNLRRNTLESMGWKVVIVTYEDLNSDAGIESMLERVAAKVREQTHSQFHTLPEIELEVLCDGRRARFTGDWWMR